MYLSTLPVAGGEFRDRVKQLAVVEDALKRLAGGAPKWLALLGQRKVGKTSLLLEAARRVKLPLVFVTLDVFNLTPVTDEVFRHLALRVVEQLFAEECGQSLEATLSPAAYRAALSGAPRLAKLPADLRALLLDLREVKLTALSVGALLDVPERLAQALGVYVAVAIDEFQELADLRVGRPSALALPLMRARWQKHRRVAYFVSGSARTMMTNLVAEQSSPFFGHFELLELGEFERADAVALLVDGAVPGKPVSRALAEAAVDALGGNPFYLQLLGEQLSGLDAPLDEAALKEAVSRLLFHRTGRLALFFESELARTVGRSWGAQSILEQLARAPGRPADLQTALKQSSSSVVNYLRRLGDVVMVDDDGVWKLTDPVMALWLRWRTPGGAAVPMKVLGDEAELAAANALAALNFNLVYQARASRGAFDLLAIRDGVMVGVQVKRSALPVHLKAAEAKRIEAEGARLSWHAVLAAVAPEGAVTFLDPRKGRRGRGLSLGKAAIIPNLLTWVDREAAKDTPRRRAR